MASTSKRRSDQSVDDLSRSSDVPSRSDKRLRVSPPDDVSEDEGRSHLAQPSRDFSAIPATRENTIDPSTQTAHLIATQAQFERIRDEGESDDDRPQDEHRKVEKMKRDMGRHMENISRENGVIERVTCINFMCHKQLTIELGPLINFIIGHNGSGKSAVLTAIQLCLGGKATSTNRGQNLKSFVKEGEDDATLIVQIKNRGDSSYRPDVYGSSIIVERHLSRRVPSSFKIKNSAGKIISTKRSELDDICDFYALQIDNPVNVLTQDMARQFLNSSSESDKYKFFIKGVQLEQLDNDYSMVWDSLISTSARLEVVAENTQALKQTYREAHEKFSQLNQQNELRSKMDRTKRQVAWVQVAEEEKKLEDLEQSILAADEFIEKEKRASTKADEAYTDTNQAHVDALAAADALRGEEESLLSTFEEAKGTFNTHKDELLQLQSDQRQVHGQLQEAEKSKQRLEKDIQEERQRLEDADGGAQANKLAEIEEAERDLAEARKKHQDHPEAKPRLDSDFRVAELRLRDLKDAKERKSQEVSRAEDQLKSLRADRGDRRQVYHHTLTAFQRAVDAETRWREKPIGPIGDYIQLLKPEWSSIMERTFGNTLGGFIVTSKQDESLISAIAKRTRYFSPMYVTKSAPINTSNNEPDGEFDTMMRVLKFDNDLVRNQAIIVQNVDQILLIQDKEAAERVMFRSGRPPRNAKAAVCLNPSRKGWGIRLSGAEESQKMDPIPPWGRIARLKTDIETQIRMQDEVVRGLKQELGEVENQYRHGQEKVKKCQQAIKAHSNQAKALLAEMQTSEDLVDTLKTDLEAAAPQDGKLDALKDQLRETETEREVYETQYQASKDEKRRLDERGIELKRAADQAKAAHEEQKHKLAKAEKTVHKAADKRQARLREKNEAQEAVKSAEQNKKSLEEERDEQRGQVQEFNEAASGICPRVPVDGGETYDSLSKKYEKMEKQLQRAERELGGTREQITAEALKAKEAWKKAEASRVNLKRVEGELNESLCRRCERWVQFRRQISSRARIQFIYLMSERGFHGRLMLDHKRKTLQLNVQPDPSARRRGSSERQGNRSGGETTTLSGGEKSFSTICLLLALWDAMGSPIRCLDEFDVFMDSVNRETSMRMMIQAARRSVGRQFILITPQAMNKLPNDPDVRVHRMADPERGQTTLNFAQ